MNYKKVDEAEIQGLWEKFCLENFNEALEERFISLIVYTTFPKKRVDRVVDFFEKYSDMMPKPIEKDSLIFKFLDIIKDEYMIKTGNSFYMFTSNGVYKFAGHDNKIMNEEK